MSVNESDFDYPESPTQTQFTKREWQRAERAVKKLRERLRASCKHLIKASSPAKKRAPRAVPPKTHYEDSNQKLREAERIASGYEE